MSKSTLAWVLVALFAVSACGDDSSDVPSSAQSSAAAEEFSQVDLLNSYVPATGAEFWQGTKFVSAVRNVKSSLTNACMEKSGFSSTIRTGDFQLFNNVEFPDLERIEREKYLVPGGPLAGMAEAAEQSAPSIPEGQKGEYLALSVKCQESATKVFADVTKIGDALRSDWLDEVHRIQASDEVLKSRAKFSSCAVDAGVSASDAATFEGFMAWVTGEMTQVPTSEDMPAEDRRWAEVFIKCAGDTVRLQESLQMKAKEKFVQDRYSQIQELQKAAQIELKAARQQVAAS